MFHIDNEYLAPSIVVVFGDARDRVDQISNVDQNIEAAECPCWVIQECSKPPMVANIEGTCTGLMSVSTKLSLCGRLGLLQ